MRRTATFVASVLVACSVPVAARQEPQPIPADIVTLITRFGAMAGADADLRPGGPPAGFPAEVVPAGAVVHASLVSPTRGTTVVATAADSTLADIERHWEGLAGVGWAPQGPSGRGGFVSSPVAAMPTWTLCRGSEFVTLAPSPRDAGGFHLRMTYLVDARRGCAPGGMSTLMADVVIPRLMPPEGSRPIGAGGSGSSLDSMTTTTRLETTLEPAAVSAHYERALVAGGWTVVGRLADDAEVTIVRFEVPSKAGPSLVGSLSVTRLGTTGDIDVFLRIVRTTRDPRMMGPGVFQR